MSLAATLGKEGLVSNEPDLGAVVEGFDDESAPVESDTSEATELQSLTDTSTNAEHDGERHVESVEISAHDMDIGEWKEPERPRQHSNTDVVEPDRGEAEADLRRVIDDFAEEHRQQLDADAQSRSASSVTTETNVGSTSTSTEVDGLSDENNEPVTTEDDEDGVQRTRLYGISGAVDSELNSDRHNEADDLPLDKQHGDSKSGEP